ncbi:hypothetical protein KBZ94_15205 [Streptomyces sp. RM72]|uniref:hypothetical protein n=1 Tax=unclassified Streptomyces TaxID=2593676 RepID=UPI0007504515|nr:MULTISPECIES: hypothetical protein [unclassified Streptomyces]MBQ0886262.1 hypothetical protein [Streptomyces sp. RM72]OMI89162.1 hypothetical protein BSZ07_13940 [Streptomyces sp. M1013]
MKQIKRAAVAALATTALAGAGLMAATGPAAAETTAASYGKTYLTFDYSSWSHWSPDALDSTHAGTLNKGRNYVYCWTYGATYTDKGRTSRAWFLTDDDSGNRNVYVTKVYLARSDVSVPVPRC